MANPLVSICIPTYNGEAFLQEALDSVLKQTYSNLEVVISDDASNDRTLHIISKFRDSSNLPISLYHNEPSSIGANWNNTIINANGEYIKFLFQDDVLLPNCISEMVTVLEAHPEVGLVASKRIFITESSPSYETKQWIDKYGNLQKEFEKSEELTYIDKTLFTKDNFLNSHIRNKIGEPTAVMFKRKLVEEVGYFDEDLEQILDYVFYYRLLKKHPILIINKPLVKFRLHSSQATQINNQKHILDYEKYDLILYKQFFSFLNPEHKKRLALKYSIKNKIKQKLKRVFFPKK